MTGRKTGSRTTKEKRFNFKMRAKLLFVVCVVLICVAALIIRILYLNSENGERYKKRVLSQQSYVSVTEPYQRGSILDRNGVALAQSTKVFNVILDAKVLLDNTANVDPTVEALVSVFGYEEASIRERLEKQPESQYAVLGKGESALAVLDFEALAAENKKIKGVWFETEYVRSYPYASLASHVIGFTNAGNVGTWGIEQYYDELLNGIDGRTYGYYDAELNLQKTVKEAQNGHTLVSTIDVNIQTMVERNVKAFIEEVGCKNIGVIVLAANSGEVYAMVSNEGFDLNNPRDLSAYYTQEEIDAMTAEETLYALNQLWRNYCVNDTFEPGSTFKCFTIAAALEENLIRANQEFNCPGYYIKATNQINCNKKSGHGTLTLAQAVMKSCNCALMDIGEQLGATLFRHYQEHFFLGQRTGIDLPGEAAGILMDEGRIGESELATSSFGQSFNVTMVQIAAAYASLVNGGYYYRPHVVKEIRTAGGALEREIEPELMREAISAETSEFLREALYLTVEEGTATPAKTAGYLVGGKTGTAQKLPREDRKYVVSFAGCAPADDPQVVVYIAIDEVDDEQLYNSSSPATRLSSQLMTEILPYLGIYPDGEITYRVELPLSDDMQDNDGEFNTEAIDPNGDPLSPEAGGGETTGEAGEGGATGEAGGTTGEAGEGGN